MAINIKVPLIDYYIIYVMFETNYYKAAHYQSTTIQHLKYQNELLINRNQTLAQQNTQLLEQLQLYEQKMAKHQKQGFDRVLKQKNNFVKRSIQINNHLFQNIDPKLSKMLFKPLEKYQLALKSQEKSVQTIHLCLIEILSKLIQENTSKKGKQIKSFINETESKLLARKNARDLSERMTHLIKQPYESLLPQYKLIRQELDVQQQFYEKMIRKVKRQNIKVATIDDVSAQIDQLMQARWNFKVQENRLIILERQFEAGKIDILGHSKCLENMEKAKGKVNNIKQSFEITLNQMGQSKEEVTLKRTLRA